MGLTPGRYAALDIGTVTCRLLVADVDASGGLHERARECRITNLGEGVDASGVLKPQAMERVANTVKVYLDVLGASSEPGRPRPSLTAVATSAARDARNASEFKALLAGLGVELSVIPGSKEAALSFRGASSDFLDERLLVVDIGGGSTEIVAGLGGREPALSHSFNIGCRRVTEKFLRGDPPTADELARAREWVMQGMATYFERLRCAGFDGSRVVAVAGTATSVVSIRDRMKVYDAGRVHKAAVSRADLDEVYAHLSTITQAQREQVVGLDPGRAPIIVAGLLILQSVLELAGVDVYTASEADILQGIILDAACRAQV